MASTQKNAYEADIPLDQLIISPVKIRDLQKDSPHYVNLKRSIAEDGYNRSNKILVRPAIDYTTRNPIPNKFEICNGWHRFNACKELGLKTIPAVIDPDLDDEDMAQKQYILNEAVPTSMKDKLNHFKKYSAQHPEMTQAQVAAKFRIHPSELSKILRLDKLSTKAQALVDAGSIKPSAATAIASIPTEFQDQFLDEAVTMPVGDFIEHVAAQRKAINEAIRNRTGVVDKAFAPKLVSKLEATRMLEEVKENLETMSQDDDKYEFVSGQVTMAERFLQVDPETIRRNQEIRDSRKADRDRQRAEKKRQEADKILAGLENRNQVEEPAGIN